MKEAAIFVIDGGQLKRFMVGHKLHVAMGNEWQNVLRNFHEAYEQCGAKKLLQTLL